LKETARLENSLKTLGGEAELLQRRTQLDTEQIRLRKSLAEAEARTPREAPQQQDAAPEDPAASLCRLQDTFHRNGVRLVCATAEAPDGPAHAGSAVADTLRRTGVSHPKTWNVMVETPYAALLCLLDDCGTNRVPVVPVALSMRPGPGDSKTTYWTLSVCL
jgi:hypothetical protein